MTFSVRSSRFRREAALATLALFLPLLLAAAPQAVKDSSEAKLRLQKFETHRQMRAASPFKDIAWTFVGPMHMTGRVVDVAADPLRPKEIYAAAAVGGVFKSTDDGANWTPIFEDFPAPASAISPWLPPTPISSGSGPERPTSFEARWPASAFINLSTPGPLSNTWAWPIPSTSPGFLSIRKIPTSSMSPRPATNTPSARTAASIKRRRRQDLEEDLFQG